jgi:hypothetical protein
MPVAKDAGDDGLVVTRVDARPTPAPLQPVITDRDKAEAP